MLAARFACFCVNTLVFLLTYLLTGPTPGLHT